MSAEPPTYIGSASYAPCPECGEGSLTWDLAEQTSRCAVCEGGT